MPSLAFGLLKIDYKMTSTRRQGNYCVLPENRWVINLHTFRYVSLPLPSFSPCISHTSLCCFWYTQIHSCLKIFTLAIPNVVCISLEMHLSSSLLHSCNSSNAILLQRPFLTLYFLLLGPFFFLFYCSP